MLVSDFKDKQAAIDYYNELIKEYKTYTCSLEIDTSTLNVNLNEEFISPLSNMSKNLNDVREYIKKFELDIDSDIGYAEQLKKYNENQRNIY